MTSMCQCLHSDSLSSVVLLTIKVQKEGWEGWLAIWQGSQDAGDHTLVAGTRVIEGGGGGGGRGCCGDSPVSVIW